MEMVLLAGLVILALIVTAAVLGSLVRAALWILFLPFRVVGWLLFLPLLLLKAVVAIVGVVLTPVVAVVAAVVAALVAGLFVPLLPVLVIAAFVWLVVKVSRPSQPIRAVLRRAAPRRRALSKRRVFRQNEPSPFFCLESCDDHQSPRVGSSSNRPPLRPLA